MASAIRCRVPEQLLLAPEGLSQASPETNLLGSHAGTLLPSFLPSFLAVGAIGLGALRAQDGRVAYDPEKDPGNTVLVGAEKAAIARLRTLIVCVLNCEGVSATEIEWTDLTLKRIKVVKDPRGGKGLFTYPEKTSNPNNPYIGGVFEGHNGSGQSGAQPLPGENGIGTDPGGWSHAPGGAPSMYNPQGHRAGLPLQHVDALAAAAFFGELGHQELDAEYDDTGNPKNDDGPPPSLAKKNTSEVRVHHRAGWFLLALIHCGHCWHAAAWTNEIRNKIAVEFVELAEQIRQMAEQYK